MVQLLRRKIGTVLSLAVQCCAASAYGQVIQKGDWYWAFVGCSVLCSFCLWSGYSEGRLVLGFCWLFSVVQLLPMVRLLRRKTGIGLLLAVQCCTASAYGQVIEKGDWYWAFVGCSVLCSFCLWSGY